MKFDSKKKIEFTDNYNKVYLQKSNNSKPKEYFTFIAKSASKDIKKYQNPLILDIGCAAGDFLWYLKQLFPAAVFTGIDIIPEYLENSRKKLPYSRFLNGDIFTGKNLPKEKFDIVFMNGVHTIFDEYKPWISHVLNLLDKKGKAYIFGLFNNYNIDVIMRYRHATENNPWLSGLNLFSKKTIGIYLTDINVKYSFKDFFIKIDLPYQPHAPLRSWTIKTEQKKRIIVSGTNLIYTFSLLKMQRK